MELNLDKSTWKPVTFGDVVREVRTSIKDPKSEGIERVVGLEHIEPENIHLREWASIDEGTTFTKGFKAGHVLFGRRRAYLKKAALADFNGICSGDITVMEAKEELLPALLPFLVCNDAFFDYAVKHSAGGLSPRTKFKDIANYEFLLPPKDQQAKLAKLLWAADEVIKKGMTLKYSVKETAKHIFYNAVFEESKSLDTHFGRLRSRHRVAKIGDHIEQLQYGISESLNEQEGIPVLRMNNLQNGKLDLRDLKYLNASKEDLKDFIVNKGDILFNRTNSFDLVGKVSLFDEDILCSFASYLIRIKTSSESLDSRYLSFFLNTELGKAKVRKYRTPGVSQSNINAQNLRVIRIPLPDLQFQKELMDRISKVEYELIHDRNERSRKLLKSLINEIF